MQREISWPVAVLSLAQAILFVTAIAIVLFVGGFWPTAAAMLVLGVEAIRSRIFGRISRLSAVLGWSMTIFIWGTLLLQLDASPHLKTYHLFIALFLTLGLSLSGKAIKDTPRQLPWHAMAMALGLMAALSWLVLSYLANRFFEFHLAVLAAVVLLVAGRIFLPLSGAAIQVVHTLLLALIGLPVADALTRPSYQMDAHAETGKHYYSFAAAQEDPVAFSSWWSHFLQEWNKLHKAISVKDTEKVVRYRMAANSQTRIFDSTVTINSLGFRGPEISLEKRDAYRIVALGESTTFGCTITKEGTPWPRVLEQKLKQGLQPEHPIEVINAGVYGLTLEENNERLKKRILRLKPDMVISYHGINFFHSLDPAVPPLQGFQPPEYQARPLKLLADFEYQAKVRLYKSTLEPALAKRVLPAADPMDSPYAKEYRELIEITRTNNIKLVIANYSMSVNAQSGREIIEFYRAGFPGVRRKIKANEVHTGILEQLDRDHPAICFVDTHPILDGQHEKYIDLVHFTQAGREDLAEIIYQAIDDLVASDLAKPPPQPEQTVITGTAPGAEAG